MIHRKVSDKRFQIDSLDGLRGFAALLVVLSHTSNIGMHTLPYANFEDMGKSGVFLFFLLSSFLLSIPLLHKGRAVLSLSVMSHYWQRRFFRIYPLYILYLLLGFISTIYIGDVIGKPNTGIPFDLSLDELAKHLLLLEGKGVTWSIAVEFKFYFILPIVIFLISTIRQRGILITLFPIVFMIIISLLISPQSESLKNDSRLLPYMPIFLTGIQLAVIQIKLNDITPSNIVNRSIQILGYIGVIGILATSPAIATLFGETIPKQYFHKQFLLYSIFWSFIILSAINVQGGIQRFFLSPILRFYGALSFSLYLFHPIFISAFNQLDLNSYIQSWGVILASTITSYISFKLLESPASKIKLPKLSSALPEKYRSTNSTNQN